MKTKTTAKKAKSKPPAVSHSGDAHIRDTPNSTNTPLPSPLSLAGVTPVEVATIAAHLSAPGITARDCVIRAYELLEWATFANNALRNGVSDNYSPSGIGDWLSLQVSPITARDSQAAFQRVATNAATAGALAGMTKMKRQKMEKRLRDEQREKKRCDEIVLEHLRFDRNEDGPLPISLETALPLIIPGKNPTPLLDLFRPYLCTLRGATTEEAERILETWGEDGMPWSAFEEALFGYFRFKTDCISDTRSKSSAKAVAAKKGKQGRVRSRKDGRLGARPPTGIF